MSPQYIPDRNDIVWLDFEPTKGREIGKYRPALVLSSKAYNRQTGLLICCPVSTSIRGGSTEVPVNNLDKASVVAASLVQTLAWKNRQAKFITCAELGVMDEVLLRLLPLMGADKLIEKIVNESLE
ncbi:type II toxin-antitoxin system PemK/MazF family toxin [Beggiatoa alba]|nr:type II toxin-antitoxin system PemK/MazF family toxin [Beggiatoa alba]